MDSIQGHTALLKVVSASRRVDLVAAYPDKFIELLRAKAPPEWTHTLVIWTKNPWRLLNCAELRDEIRRYRNLFLHLTVTGMGRSVLEPNVPSMDDVISLLNDVTVFFGGGEYVRLRFDPIVHIRMANSEVYTNFDYFEKLQNS